MREAAPKLEQHSGPGRIDQQAAVVFNLKQRLRLLKQVEGLRAVAAQQGEARLRRERGLIRFVGPADHAPRSDFGATRFWLRARWAGGSFPVAPRLRRVLLGTTWAVQAGSVRDEPPAPSSGLAGQLLRLSRAPVLPGERVEIFEPELHPGEQAALAARLGPDTLAPDPRRPDGRWVRRQETPDFYGSAPDDRHYTLDRSAGELRFGDGRRGMIPHAGPAAIRVAFYRTGGGARGVRHLQHAGRRRRADRRAPQRRGPARALLDAVDDYVRARCPAGVMLGHDEAQPVEPVLNGASRVG